MDKLYDIAIVGGGINGCGIAADAAIRGLSVVLLEKDDLASKTSSSSSKLIHGGLRYLEHYDFKLVKKALDERQILLTVAPHLVHPLPFVIPYEENMRPTWLLRTGLFLYDHLSRKNKLPKSRFLKRPVSYFNPLKESFKKGFLFYDCQTDDTRLTIINALQAKIHGAEIKNYSEVLGSAIHQNEWILNVRNHDNLQTIRAKVVINATGPWVEKTNQLLNIPNTKKLSLVKGSHLLIEKLYDGDHGYLLQHPDKRIVFIVPYQNLTMIGTTDVAFNHSLDVIQISKEEITYLLNVANTYFNRSIKEDSIVLTWSGVRPLIASKKEELSALSRDYAFQYSDKPAPCIAIYGGKITTYRELAREALDSLKSCFPLLAKSKTKNTPLPGATWHELSLSSYTTYINQIYPWLPELVKNRYLASYGTRSEMILNKCNKLSDLGIDFGFGLFQREVDYLIQEEWAQHAQDILWRRSKLGIQFSPKAIENLQVYVSSVLKKPRLVV